MISVNNQNLNNFVSSIKSIALAVKQFAEVNTKEFINFLGRTVTWLKNDHPKASKAGLVATAAFVFFAVSYAIYKKCSAKKNLTPKVVSVAKKTSHATSGLTTSCCTAGSSSSSSSRAPSSSTPPVTPKHSSTTPSPLSSPLLPLSTFPQSPPLSPTHSPIPLLSPKSSAPPSAPLSPSPAGPSSPVSSSDGSNPLSRLQDRAELLRVELNLMEVERESLRCKIAAFKEDYRFLPGIHIAHRETQLPLDGYTFVGKWSKIEECYIKDSKEDVKARLALLIVPQTEENLAIFDEYLTAVYARVKLSNEHAVKWNEQVKLNKKILNLSVLEANRLHRKNNQNKL